MRLYPLAQRQDGRFDSADHSFHVAARTGRRDVDVRRELIDATATWILALA